MWTQQQTQSYSFPMQHFRMLCARQKNYMCLSLIYVSPTPPPKKTVCFGLPPPLKKEKRKKCGDRRPQKEASSLKAPNPVRIELSGWDAVSGTGPRQDRRFLLGGGSIAGSPNDLAGAIGLCLCDSLSATKCAVFSC